MIPKNALRALLIAPLLLMTACATEKAYRAQLETWKGKPEVALVGSWGIPDEVYEIDSRTKVLEYNKLRREKVPVETPETVTETVGDKTTTTEFSSTTLVTRTYKCTTSFTLLDGRVIEYAFKGNSCVAFD